MVVKMCETIESTWYHFQMFLCQVQKYYNTEKVKKKSGYNTLSSSTKLLKCSTSSVRIILMLLSSVLMIATVEEVFSLRVVVDEIPTTREEMGGIVQKQKAYYVTWWFSILDKLLDKRLCLCFQIFNEGLISHLLKNFEIYKTHIVFFVGGKTIIIKTT